MPRNSSRVIGVISRISISGIMNIIATSSGISVSVTYRGCRVISVAGFCESSACRECPALGGTVSTPENVTFKWLYLFNTVSCCDVFWSVGSLFSDPPLGDGEVVKGLACGTPP